MKKTCFLFPVFSLLLILPSLLFARPQTFEVTGMLQDEESVPVAGHPLRLYNSNNKLLATDTTTVSGEFSLIYEEITPGGAGEGKGEASSRFQPNPSYPNPFNLRTSIFVHEERPGSASLSMETNFEIKAAGCLRLHIPDTEGYFFQDILIPANEPHDTGMIGLIIPILDIDGNKYGMVIIGEQKWLDRDLRVTRFQNGDIIPAGLNNTEWYKTDSDSFGALAVYPHNLIDDLFTEEEVIEAYGFLYNWYAVDDSRGLCPEGWRVPGDPDWAELLNYLVLQGYPNSWGNPHGAANALKSRRQVNSPLGAPWDTSEHPRWHSNNTHYGRDIFGFAGLPGGLRTYNGDFRNLGTLGSWWSSTGSELNRGWLRRLYYGYGYFIGYDLNKRFGFSVRCLQD